MQLAVFQAAEFVKNERLIQALTSQVHAQREVIASQQQRLLHQDKLLDVLMQQKAPLPLLPQPPPCSAMEPVSKLYPSLYT